MSYTNEYMQNGLKIDLKLNRKDQGGCYIRRLANNREAGGRE